MWFDSVLADFMRVELSDPGNVSGYIEAGRVFLGRALSPKYNPLWGLGMDYRSQTTVTRTRAGSLISDNRPSYRVLDFQLAYMSEREAMQMYDILNAVGIKSDAVISIYPDSLTTIGQRTTLLGRFIGHSPITTNKTGYNISISFEEAL
jgi:hypothetical protein